MPVRSAGHHVLGLLPASDYRAAVLNTPGLVAYWRLADATSVMADETNQRAGTWTVPPGLRQPSPVPGGAMVYLNGSTQYGAIVSNAAFSPGTTGQMSWAFWTVPTNATTSHAIAKGDGAQPWEWSIMRGLSPIFLDGQGFVAQMWQSGGNSYAVVDSGAGSAPNGQLVHVAATLVQASALTIYINGQPRGRSTSFTSTMTPGTSAVNIGRRPDNTRFYAGSVGEMAIWSRALTAGEVAMLYEAGVSRPGMAA